ncbi:hypothetical protein LJ656_25295 [Paraburkholderia sp. MMS20-SJTR3]|uniref:Uncharacterized protein n=1 Tax=Paraburkholderia sejongensis TaxID=2886946 RepID=A0ABS8K1Z1_9BURK|nr:hypothetical protein [Paraburkholderia sp. MMS20-SJTR3]MCC8395904.1 hypothetical protein [Paraburkholderia sp. MMS20-SJTR3]
MATRARKQFKAFLFLGLFYLAGRYVHAYPLEMPEILWELALRLDSDPEELYALVFATLDLVISLLVWSYLTRRLRLRDPDDWYFIVVLIFQTLVGVFVWSVVASWLGLDHANNLHFGIFLAIYTFIAVSAIRRFASRKPSGATIPVSGGDRQIP